MICFNAKILAKLDSYCLVEMCSIKLKVDREQTLWVPCMYDADDDDSPSQGVRVIKLSGAIDGDTTRIN